MRLARLAGMSAIKGTPLKPTVKDVASKAGVSPITVSRVINGGNLVSEQTRRAVLEAIEELGYKPNLLARSLVHGSAAPLVGFVATELANPFYAPLISAVQEVARLRDHLVVIADSERHLANEATYLQQFERLRIGGVLVTPLSPDSGPLETLRSAGVPVVVVARRWEDGDYVTADNTLGGRMVGSHLLDLGHRHIAVVALDEPGHTAAADRLAGFRARLAESNLEAPTIWTKSLSTSEGASSAGEILALSPRPTAVFVMADRLAIGVVHELLKCGIGVPDELSVVGYDDIHYSAFLEVPLTTVALPTAEIGRIAAEILFDRMAAGASAEPWRQVLLPPRLVIRASTGSAVIGSKPSRSASEPSPG
jgi:LacI family transcriptional regulator, galactose operon repressor